MKKASLSAVLALFLLALVSPAGAGMDLTYEAEPTGEAMVADLAIARPAGFVALVFGTAVSFVALPFALMSGSTAKMYQKLVVEPYCYTFGRPLGEGTEGGLERRR